MPRSKPLNGVAHNIGHSFTSLMNYATDDYSMGHVLRFARETGRSELTIDFMSGQGSPAALLREPIADMPEWYTKTFWRLVQSSGSDRSLVHTATLTLKYDLQRSIPGPIANERQNPYTCDVSIEDVRGKHYRSHFQGWWYVERMPSSPVSHSWWNPLRWFGRS